MLGRSRQDKITIALQNRIMNSVEEDTGGYKDPITWDSMV